MKTSKTETRVTVFTNAFYRTHARQPSGNAFWAFSYGSQNAKPEFMGPMSYAEARKAAIARARELGTCSVFLCP